MFVARMFFLFISSQVVTVEATRGEVTANAMKLEEELEHTKRVHGETAERLSSRSADVESVTRSLVSESYYPFLLVLIIFRLYKMSF